MKIKIEIKNRWTGALLFEYEKENNTVKDTLMEAVRQNANLGSANLYGADLCGANLYGANLYGANLYGANLGSANLGSANLYGADLCGANLYGADLYGANLRGANLHYADLRVAKLFCANLRGASFYSANLFRASFRGADLRDTDFDMANISDVDFHDAYLGGAKNIPFVPFACPSDGAFIGWKKVRGCLIKLEIPEDARRQSATGTKCRCDKAKVLSIIDLETNEELDKVTNTEYTLTDYIVGEMVYPDSFDDDRWNECSHGIHFFINKQEAINY